MNPSPSIESRVYGCWLGKSIGGTLGLPSEGKMERQNYTFYDPVPITAPPNDDLELQLVWLHLVEQSGAQLTRDDFAQAWLRHIHYMWDEYGRCRWNLRRGVPLDVVGTFENPFGASMGSPIRSEIWACLFPGDPASAAWYAATDAALDHGVEGIAGEVFFAVLQSLVIGGTAFPEAMAAALEWIPAGSETNRAVRLVIQHHREGRETWTSWKDLLAAHRSDNFTHAPLNVALTIWALLHGANDFGATILLATNGGYDTDCTAATAGAILGLAGHEAIPPRWSAPIGDGVLVGPGIVGISAPTTLQELTQRTVKLIGKLARKDAADLRWATAQLALDGAALPGSIRVQPRGESTQIPWANGELGAEVKRAGGATWTWEVAGDESRFIVCLARAGAKLFVDGQLVIDCPPSLPYVPATHRSPRESRASFRPGPGRHEVKLELNSRDENQEATVLLAYPDMHIAPWTAQELPERAILPPA